MDKTKKQLHPAWNAILIGVKLLIICAVVAAVVSGVNTLTAEKYEENLNEQKRLAIVEIFGDDVTFGALELAPDADKTVIYEIKAGNALIGYCVEVSSAGFGGDIHLTVGYNADRSVRGVSIVSMSETPGLGTKVNDAMYLNGQYVGKRGELVLDEDVDAVSGATVSSKAVLAGVNRATAALESALEVKA